MFFKTKLDSVEYKFICFSDFNVDGKEEFHLYKDHSGFSSELYLSSGKDFLMKMEKDKYSAKNHFFRWFFRDFLKRIFFIGSDAKREYKGYRIAQSAGLSTPKLYSWGVSLSPFNKFYAFIMIDNELKSTPGLVYVRSLSESDKVNFFIRLANEVVILAKCGYVHRDFHLNNFLIDESGKILWIDTHFKKLSKFKDKRWEQLVSSLNDDKLGGVENKNIILSTFKEIFKS